MLDRKEFEVTERERKLSGEEIGFALSGAGNHEGKGVTLLAIAEGGPYTESVLDRELHSLQGKNIGWDIGAGTSRQYCDRSFIPTGLVLKEGNKYRISALGKKVAPLIALLLDFSLRHNVSEALLFGGTQSRSPAKGVFQADDGVEIEIKDRAPTTTLKIFYELITAPDMPLREIDISTRIKTPRNVISLHLERLAETGLINFKTVKVNTHYSAATIVTTVPDGIEITPFARYTALTRTVFEIFRNYPGEYLTIKDVYNLLPETDKQSWGQNAHMHTLSAIIAHLRKNKIVTEKQFHWMKNSETTVSDNQKAILAELLEIIDRFQDRDPEVVSAGEKLVSRIIQTPSIVSGLLRKARENSSFVDTLDKEKGKLEIAAIILAHPGITNAGIRELLKAQGRKMGVERVQQLTRDLRGTVDFIREGSVKKYFLKTQAQVTS